MAVVAGIVALSSAGVIAATPGVSGASPQPAVGSVNCPFVGTGKFGPKLTAAGVPTTAVKYKFVGATPTTGVCTGSAGIPNSAGALTPVTVFGVKVKGLGYLSGPANANSCPVFSTIDGAGTVVAKLIWSASSPITPTVITYTSGGPAVSGSPTDTIAFPSGASMTVTGSFSSAGTGTISMLTNIVSACSATWGPYPNHTIGTGSYVQLP